MGIQWCHNAKTGEIFNYKACGELTDFPRGTWLAYGDYLTTGMGSREEAEEWAKEWVACETCKEARSYGDGKCRFCGSPLPDPPKGD